MPYTTNKKIPSLRREAVQLVRKGWSARKVGRHFGFTHTAVMEWVRRGRILGDHPIPTKSSKPKHHPKQLSEELVQKIIQKRLAHGRYAEVVYHELLNDGIKVSLSSVKRTLERHGLIKKRNKRKWCHPPVKRPIPLKLGDLVQMDTIHRMISEKKRLYVFTLIDVHSRRTYAKASMKMNGRKSLKFVREAETEMKFKFDMIQSDHGPEFSSWFVSRIKKTHRYTRLGKPNDNAHIERFNRTLQEECLDKLPNDVRKINCALKKYLQYYNSKRLHTGINFLTPMQVV